jgi:hypothetical protein
MERIERERWWHARCWVLRDRSQDPSSGPFRDCPIGEGADWYRPYFENYTVDASILDPRPSGLEIYMVNWRAFGRVIHWSISAGRAFGQRRRRSIQNSCSQVSKSRRWMPWHLEPKKDVAICDKPRGVDKQTLIRGCPNGETPSGALVRPDDSRLNI